tara:strand:+ start:647 stop:847 length:201 start_codon:yes stop_codon:yes gene_type:complete
MEETPEKARLRLIICLLGLTVFCFVLCCGLRQLALLDERVQRGIRYAILEQELVELIDESLEEFDE